MHVRWTFADFDPTKPEKVFNTEVTEAHKGRCKNYNTGTNLCELRFG